jgi:glucose-6-phosphate-specific signal transduction histidine kinase
MLFAWKIAVAVLLWSLAAWLGHEPDPATLLWCLGILLVLDVMNAIWGKAQ